MDTEPDTQNIGQPGQSDLEVSTPGVTQPAPVQPTAPEEASEPEEGSAEAQAPVATANDRAIVGDSGLFNQQPVGAAGNADMPYRQSPPPASLQSGVPVPIEPAPDAAEDAPEGERAE